MTETRVARVTGIGALALRRTLRSWRSSAGRCDRSPKGDDRASLPAAAADAAQNRHKATRVDLPPRNAVRERIYRRRSCRRA